MANPRVHNVNVANQRVLISPSTLRDIIEVPEAIYEFVSASRTTIERIIDRQDHRLMVIVGPCSIHDADAALIRQALKTLSSRVADDLYLVMRVYLKAQQPLVEGSDRASSTIPEIDGLSIGRTLLGIFWRWGY